MDVIKKTNHVDEGLSRLTQEYRNKTKIRALLSVFLRRTQGLENLLYDIWFNFLFPNATGNRLDQYGIFLKENRAGRLDDEYRVALQVKMRVLRSKGKPLDIIDISRIAVGADNLSYDEPVQPYFTRQGARFTVTKELIAAAAVKPLKNALRLGKSAGTTGELVYSLSPPADLFRFSSVHATTIGRGMSSVHDTAFASRLTSGEIV